MDRYTKKVIAWDLGKRMTVELVQRTLKKPIRVFSGTSKPFIIQNESIKV